MPLSQMEWIVLDLVRSRGCDLRKISEPFRQAVITLGVAEPPLLDVTADHAWITEAGRAALKANPNY